MPARSGQRKTADRGSPADSLSQYRGKRSGRERWLLVKVADQYAAGRSKARKSFGAESVKSGKTIEEMAADGGDADDDRPA